MTPNEIVNAFANKDAMAEKYKRSPWYENGYTYATDGAILVRCTGKHTEREDECPSLESKNVWFFLGSEYEGFSLTNQDQLMKPAKSLPPCKKCTTNPEEVGGNWGCYECEGKGGVFEIYYRENCASCKGEGLDRDLLLVEISGMFFNPNYIKKILRIGADTIFVIPPKTLGLKNMLFFRSPNSKIQGVLMSLTGQDGERCIHMGGNQ